MELHKTKTYPNIKKWLWRATLLGPSFLMVLWAGDLYSALLYPEDYHFGSEAMGRNYRTQGIYVFTGLWMPTVGILCIFGELLCSINLIRKLSRSVSVFLCLLFSVLVPFIYIESLELGSETLMNSMNWIVSALFDYGRYVLYIWLLFILLKAGSDWSRQRRGDGES